MGYKLMLSLLVFATAAHAGEGEAEPLSVQLKTEVTLVYPLEPVTMIVTVRNDSNETVKYFNEQRSGATEFEGLDGKRWSVQPDGPSPVAPFEGFFDSVVHIGAKAVMHTVFNFPASKLAQNPGKFRHRVIYWSNGKAVVRRGRMRWLQTNEDQPQPPVVVPSDETIEAGDDDHDPVEIKTWNRKIESNVVEVQLRNLETESDKQAYRILTEGVHYFLWQRGNWEHVKRLQQVLKDHPDSLYAKYCAFFLAQSLTKTRPDQALALFQKVIDDYPTFQFTDDAKLYIAKRYAGSKNLEKALPLLEDILKSHPGSSGAIVAEAILAQLEVKSTAKADEPKPMAKMERAE